MWAIGVLVVLAGGIGAFVVVNDDDGTGDAAASTTTSSTVTTALEDTTTTSTLGTTSTTTRATTSTTARATTTSTARSSTTTAAPVPVCGSGKATVSFTAKDLVTDALSSTFTPQVTVDNQVSAPIEVEEVVIEITYPNNEVRTVSFTTAGTVIGPGTSASFTSDKLTSAQRYQAVRFTRFTYFTEGKRADCRVTTP